MIDRSRPGYPELDASLCRSRFCALWIQIESEHGGIDFKMHQE